MVFSTFYKLIDDANHFKHHFSMISIIYNHIENDLNIILYHIFFDIFRASWPGPHGRGPHGQGLMAKGLMAKGLMAKGLMAKGLMARASWPAATRVHLLLTGFCGDHCVRIQA